MSEINPGLLLIVGAMQHHVQGKLVQPPPQFTDLAGDFRHDLGIALLYGGGGGNLHGTNRVYRPRMLKTSGRPGSRYSSRA